MAKTQRFTDPELNQFSNDFNDAVDRRRGSMIREHLVPRVMPPMIVGSVFANTIFLNAMEYLPHQGRAIAMVTFAGAALASPFLNRAGSPFIPREKAIQAIDHDIGGPFDRPAQEFTDSQVNPEAQNTSSLWEADKKRIKNKWGPSLLAQTRDSGFGSYYQGNSKNRLIVHGACVLSAAFSAVIMHQDITENWDTAMDWTAPPPPLVYHATITPPEGIERVKIHTDLKLKEAIETSKAIDIHEQSKLTVITYDRPASISVDGVRLAPVSADEQDNQFEYATTLGVGSSTIRIDGKSFRVTAEKDRAPVVRIDEVGPDNRLPYSLSLQYSITDDHGATDGAGRIGIADEDGTIREPVLDSNQIPTLELPYE